mmetsp:Transcript_4976/g.18025  ORF Transcript_4976/g.18025 Transcript_4976/m.18025 type:complete len:261 (+) Transcript_4976:3408-4190(+)
MRRLESWPCSREKEMSMSPCAAPPFSCSGSARRVGVVVVLPAAAVVGMLRCGDCGVLGKGGFVLAAVVAEVVGVGPAVPAPTNFSGLRLGFSLAGAGFGFVTKVGLGVPPVAAGPVDAPPAALDAGVSLSGSIFLMTGALEGAGLPSSPCTTPIMVALGGTPLPSFPGRCRSVLVPPNRSSTRPRAGVAAHVSIPTGPLFFSTVSSFGLLRCVQGLNMDYHALLLLVARGWNTRRCGKGRCETSLAVAEAGGALGLQQAA